MKLTWFGETAIRIYIGGQIFIVDPQLAPDRVDRAELVAGADRVLRLAEADENLASFDPAEWRPRKAPRAIDEDQGPPPVHAYRIGGGAMLIDAVGEPALVLVGGEAPSFGRWADGAVVVLFGGGEAMGALAEGLLAAARPKLVALAADEAAVDFVVAALKENLDGTGLVSLEAGLALEV
jgi:hypothetical protein